MKTPPRRPDASVRPGPGVRAVRTELSDAAVVSRSWGMALATLVSRITGFIRIVLLAAILGAALSSAFTVANQLPNMIAALVLEATFTAIFVPVLARAERDDPDGGEAFVRRLVTLATALLLVATVFSVAAGPLLVRLMLGQDPQVNQPLTTAFAYLLLPQVIFYGLTSVFMAILNNRNVFGPTAWAPVVNNVVAIATLGLYLLVPGELSVNPVEMGNAKLLVLGIGTTLGVVAQAAVLLVAIRAERISLRPLWGIDDRLKRFGAMAAAMVLYVVISQVGLIVGNQIASTAAASGPAIYNYAWLVLQLPFGIIGVTVLTVVMPRLSRNAAADNTPAVLADLSLATRLTMVTLIPIVALMTVGGPAIGSALFAYGKFGEVDANYLGMAIALSSFTLIPYALVLLQLRVFYAREQPWIPILIVIAITGVKIAASLVAPHLTNDRELVAGYLGLANGLGFVAGAVLGYVLLRRALNPPKGRLLDLEVIRTILVTTAASLLAGLIGYVVDRLLGLGALSERAGSAGSLLRLLILTAIMVPIVAGVMLTARVPDAVAAWGAIRRRISRTPPVAVTPVAALDRPRVQTAVTYPEHRNSSGAGPRAVRDDASAAIAGAATGKGPEVDDQPSGTPAAESPGDATTKIPHQAAGDFQPDVLAEVHAGATPPPAGWSEATREETPAGWSEATREEVPVLSRRPDAEFAGDPTREPIAFDPPRDPATESSPVQGDEPHLIPGASIAGGRYRLLVCHGGPPGLQFWQALDTALDRQVALTFIDPDRTMSGAQVDEILSRTMKLSHIERPGVARVLDVANTGTGGLVVSEWIRGGSLKEVADTSPSPIGGARAVQSLAAAADAAHSSGVALSIDHPSRVRVSIEGDVALAFPATMPDASPESDIRGIGATLYALLVDRWPLPEAGVPSGLQPADTDPAGEALEPRAVDRNIPFQISAAAARSVQAGGGIRTAPTLLNLLQQATALADRTELIDPVEPVGPASGRPRADEDPGAHARRRRNLLIGVGVGGAVLVVALVVLASVLSSIFGDVGGGLKGDQLGLNPTASPTSSTPSGDSVKPVKATVFSPQGGADNPDKADLALTGGPGTGWATDTYTDPNPFPNFKNGVGLMLQLPQPTTVGSVSLTVPSTGTQVQIRSATTANPASLDDTTALTQPTALKPGANTIAVNASAPTSYLVVWISTMGTTDGKNRTEISGLTVKAAS
ncbi:murein biosynthesis integral membrane protein MurJ [Mycolicibacterium sp. CH28]|uniref:murein biosynthesis integral membrane protein MurJ n=1 Tax=Mycolicibacterium sp. CH28 TaxID=2512237 RepID=UPI00108033EC|nr:murein biosynthesis integral membrane protein MurJ [Mycolicibacterium sp. CH28]TGD84638.1 murein biosynthesis integral membrane protein MurJ [Mycolicibacterium sp. CH28]